MEEAIPEVLLGLQVHHPSWALELSLVKGPFQPHGHHAKDDRQFVQYMVSASGGLHIPSHIHCIPLQQPDNTFQNHCLRVVVLDALDRVVPLLKLP